MFDLSNVGYIYETIGPAGIALIFLAIFALYTAIWMLIYMRSVWKNFRRDFLELERGEDRCLKDIDPSTANPMVRIIYEIVTTHSDHSNDVRAEVGYLFYRNFKKVSNGLNWLKLISVVAPLMGLLGTVWGMIDVFQSLSDVTKAQTDILAGGIWEALLTTVMGLCVAIPTLMVYYFLLLRFKEFHIEAIEHSYRALEVCRQVKFHHPYSPLSDGLGKPAAKCPMGHSPKGNENGGE